MLASVLAGYWVGTADDTAGIRRLVGRAEWDTWDGPEQVEVFVGPPWCAERADDDAMEKSRTHFRD